MIQYCTSLDLVLMKRHPFYCFNLECDFTDPDILQKKAHNENYGL